MQVTWNDRSVENYINKFANIKKIDDKMSVVKIKTWSIPNKRYGKRLVMIPNSSETLYFVLSQFCR